MTTYFYSYIYMYILYTIYYIYMMQINFSVQFESIKFDDFNSTNQFNSTFQFTSMIQFNGPDPHDSLRGSRAQPGVFFGGFVKPSRSSSQAANRNICI